MMLTVPELHSITAHPASTGGKPLHWQPAKNSGLLGSRMKRQKFIGSGGAYCDTARVASVAIVKPVKFEKERCIFD